MYTVSSAYTGVPGRQQVPHDVQTSEGQAEWLAHHPDILIMAPQGPQRITLQVSQVSKYPLRPMSKKFFFLLQRDDAIFLEIKRYNKIETVQYFKNAVL
jgi:hypothetical protein